MKSLRSAGILTSFAIFLRYTGEPRKKNSSVRTDSAAAPFLSSSMQSISGTKSSRIKPFDGEAFFSSAMILNRSLRLIAAAKSLTGGIVSVCSISISSGMVFLRTSSASRFLSIILSRIVILCWPLSWFQISPAPRRNLWIVLRVSVLPPWCPLCSRR